MLEMTEAQLQMWKSVLIDKIDYLENHEDCVVISIDKKTGDIIQQYEYEYSLDRFLEHLASLQNVPVVTLAAAPTQESWDHGGLSEDAPDLKTANGESSSESPHTDPDFKDLDIFSDTGSDGESWMTYSDTSSERSSERHIREKTSKEKLKLPCLGDTEQVEEIEEQGQSTGIDTGIKDGLALAATVNTILIACLWIAEKWERVK
ncbi:hypothetical protein ONS95_012698 [Cadophora gregata]|uniref:uncharacterized protein n=1 Tax=Cadophora gregata TaxID=51156 RepID=UPI0026DCA5AF|nr:uncharacterized protein ONS95_012698 [Cadophora gregata]KAK0118409.1 hypothetical protein ONS95_012698 [Cadophora gregata]KAK0123479.1 hypothetical protein ONS96_010462 [Cadophora gregata f. sp. sojae]